MNPKVQEANLRKLEEAQVEHVNAHKELALAAQAERLTHAAHAEASQRRAAAQNRLAECELTLKEAIVRAYKLPTVTDPNPT